MTAPATVRVFSNDHPALPRNVRAKLEKLRDELALHLANGLAQDWADYKQRVGVIQGITDAIDVCIESEKEMRD